MKENLPREILRQTVIKGKAINYERITWQDVYGVERLWETAERARGQEAVMTIPWLMPSKRLVLIQQYRPPVGKEVIEFPAGLIDNGEKPEEAALRELKEETGYLGKITAKIPPTFNTPGLSSESVYQIFMEIDENLAENRQPKKEPDDGEFIEVVTVGYDEMETFIKNIILNDINIDSKVMSYLLGLKHAPFTT